MKLFDPVCLIVEKCLCSFNGLPSLLSLELCFLQIDFHPFGLHTHVYTHNLWFASLHYYSINQRVYLLLFLSQLPCMEFLQALPLQIWWWNSASFVTPIKKNTSIVFSQFLTMALDLSCLSFLSLIGPAAGLLAPRAAECSLAHSSLLITVAA